jgi:hypothetical protein
LAPCPSSGLILHGQKDNIVPEESVAKLVEKLKAQKGIEIDYRVVPNANHFFHEKTDEMVAHVHDHMNKAQGGQKVVAQIAKAA